MSQVLTTLLVNVHGEYRKLPLGQVTGGAMRLLGEPIRRVMVSELERHRKSVPLSLGMTVILGTLPTSPLLMN